ncbi:MAG: hypothetical protein Q4C00_08185, partial [Bacillota bacterium]|nr:hypothetical protein [Bacillota bacterium]
VQSSCIVAALPLSVIVVLANISFLKALNKYEYTQSNSEGQAPFEVFEKIREDIDQISEKG